MGLVEGRPHRRRYRSAPGTGSGRYRWDAEHAVGSVDPLPTPVGVDGVDDFLWITRQLRCPEPIAFHAPDTGQTFMAGPGVPLATASASASDLVLLLYGRVSADEVAVAGDRAKLDAFLIPIG